MQCKEDQLIIKKAIRHDPDAFSELMQLYLKDMYRVAIAILMNDEDAADAIQDTILACWEKIHTLKQIQYFKTWMTKILIRKCYDIKSKEAKKIGIENYMEPVRNEESNFEFKEALASLDEKYRIVLTLFYSEGYQIDEIGKILKIPSNTVKTRLRRGREILAKNYYQDEIKE